MFSMSETKTRLPSGNRGSASLSPAHHSSQDCHRMMEQLLSLVEPVKDLFLAIFFASVGECAAC